MEWSELSRNNTITFQDILNHLNIPWNWHIISYSKLIIFQDIIDHPDLPWKWDVLSMNPSILYTENEYINYLKKYFACKKIQKQWLKVYYDPEYQICRKRLMREFSSLN